VYPDIEIMLSTEKIRKRKIKEHLRKKLFTQDTSTTSDKDMPSDDLITSELRKQIMQKRIIQESSTEQMGMIQSWLIFILKALFD